MRRLSMIAAVLAAFCASPVFAQEVRHAIEGEAPPPASIDGLDWLTGHWVGDGIGGAPAQEVYSSPAGGTITGHFVQEDGEGGIMLYEILQIAEHEGSLVYRLKHFDAALTGWEAKDEAVSFALVAIEPGALYFDGLTIRQAGQNRLIAAVRTQNADGSQGELVFYYYRAAAADRGPLCSGADTTIAMNECLAEGVDDLDMRRAEYLSAALARHEQQPEVIAQIQASQAAFEAYRDAECAAVYEKWRSGTIRGAMTLSCRMGLTRERTHRIWSNWLTYMDGATPVLPEPPRD